MRALVDRHHGDLFHSLQLLLEDRLGYEVYTPVGDAWWDESYWQFGIHAWGDRRLADQFLNIDAAWKCTKEAYFSTFDHAHPEREIRGVTLDQVRASADEWALVVATVDDNQRGFHRLAGELGATYVLQVGNTGQYIDWSLDPIALVSSEMPINGRGVVYHQEFDAIDTYGYAAPWVANRSRITSFVNCMPSTSCWPLLEHYRQLLPEHAIYVHGIDGPDGNLAGADTISAAMTGSGWAWHCKPQGDGFGHVIHNWAAVGRPLIGEAAHYQGRLAEPLWEDLVTCIDLGQRTPAENSALIREISLDPDAHAAMCDAIRARFDELVDFAAEADQIRALLNTT